MDVLRSVLGRFGGRASGSGKTGREVPKAEQKLREIEQAAAGNRPEGRLPGFLLLGAQKCGTRFLFNRLSRHPNVEPAIVKEVDFFSKHFD